MVSARFGPSARAPSRPLRLLNSSSYESRIAIAAMTIEAIPTRRAAMNQFLRTRPESRPESSRLPAASAHDPAVTLNEPDMTTSPQSVDRQPENAGWRLIAVVLGVWALSVLLLIAYVDRRNKPSTSAASSEPPAAAVFPAPPAGAVVFSREAGPDALALGVVPGTRRVRVQASVVGPDGAGVRDLTTTLSLGAASASGTACGAGCYRAEFPARGKPRFVEVSTRGSLDDALARGASRRLAARERRRDGREVATHMARSAIRLVHRPPRVRSGARRRQHLAARRRPTVSPTRS